MKKDDFKPFSFKEARERVIQTLRKEDITQTLTMKHEELQLEKQCRSHARACGWVCWKNEKNGCKGIPDDSFLSPDGNTFLLVEFKKDVRQRLRPEQETWRQRYPNVIFVIYSFDDFKALIESKSRQKAQK